MSYQVKLEVFEGPFDLLLSLISKHKVSVYDIPLADITQEYLDYLDELRQLDLEIASEFLLVAATLLEIKSAGLLPKPPVIMEDDAMTAYEQKQLLMERLLEYQQYKQAALALMSKVRAESRFFSRQAALEQEFQQLLPDFPDGVGARDLAELMVALAERERVSLIDTSHIANIKISLEDKIEEVIARLNSAKRIQFAELTAGADCDEVVASFLALLELYKRGSVKLEQSMTFGDIVIVKKPKSN